MIQTERTLTVYNRFVDFRPQGLYRQSYLSHITVNMLLLKKLISKSIFYTPASVFAMLFNRQIYLRDDVRPTVWPRLPVLIDRPSLTWSPPSSHLCVGDQSAAAAASCYDCSRCNSIDPNTLVVNAGPYRQSMFVGGGDGCCNIRGGARLQVLLGIGQGGGRHSSAGVRVSMAGFF